GPARAARAYLENRPITAEQALDWGMISEIVPADELRARATALAATLAKGPTRAFARMRKLLRETWDNDLSQQLLAETEGIKATGDTVDAANAIASFAAKRTPQFEGR
ncbi:MAG: 2-(1,2-epoxy,2-dihydrophenyl)acetyl-CoA isomerase, partial [Mycobacterium sp.]|nr:2-(1,2-epoxy,2-dihydrophenyl)acetyl-CoA isomerase [Mycobacterium sp.]